MITNTLEWWSFVTVGIMPFFKKTWAVDDIAILKRMMKIFLNIYLFNSQSEECPESTDPYQLYA
jgi:hypothetical protein